MKIGVLSGKGGTGKTLLSVNLAALREGASYIDCDIEEPNGHLFYKPENIEVSEVTVKVPIVDRELCQGSRKCVDFCRYNALTYVKDKLIIFEDLCHSCGGCIMVCPENALNEKDRPIGRIESGKSQGIRVSSGILNIGEPSGLAIIDELLRLDKLYNGGLTIIDCPPGNSCSVMESIRDSDYCILVAEPSLFGLHNLNMVYELVNLFKKPFGIVLNKTMEGYNPAKEFCIEKGIRILGEIPYDRELGHLNSLGKIAVRESDKYKKVFEKILGEVKEVLENETTTYP